MLSLEFTIECIILFVCTGALLHYYKDAQVGSIVYCFVYMSWFAGFVGVVLLPLDISATIREGDANVHSSLLIGWKLVYWLTFFLSWVLLPILIEYCQSGAFTPDQKFKGAIRYLLRHYAVLLGGGAVLLMYLVIVDHFTINGLVGLAMALSNTYGLLWIIALLGYGLVNIPRRVWAFSSPELQLRQTYFRAIQIHDDRVESMFIYEDVVRDIKEMVARFETIEQSTIIVTPEMHHMKNCLNHVMETIGMDIEAPKAKLATPMRPNKRRTMPGSPFRKDNLPMPTEGEMVALNCRAKRIKADLRRCEQAWREVCLSAQAFSALNQKTGPWRDVSPYVVGTATGVCILCSAVVMWSEVIMGTNGWLSPLGEVILHASPGIGIQLFLLLALFYMGVCVYQSLFSIRGFGRFAIHGGQNSTELSLLTTSIQQCRLQFSLGYNFFLLLNCKRVTDRTAFHLLFTDMRLIHFFGNNFSVYAPILMLLFAAMTFWQGYARLVKSLGLEQYEELIPGQVEHEAKIHQGEALVQKGIEKYARLKARQEKASTGNTADTLTEALLDDH